MSNLLRMLGRAGTTCPWDDGKKDREWSMTKRRQRRIEARETRQLADDAGRQNWPYLYRAWAWRMNGGDCRHGCNGSPCCGPACTFICHP